MSLDSLGNRAVSSSANAQKTTRPVSVPTLVNAPMQLTKKEFSALASTLDGGDKALMGKLKEIDPKKDFQRLLDTRGAITLNSTQVRNLKKLLSNAVPAAPALKLPTPSVAAPVVTPAVVSTKTDKQKNEEYSARLDKAVEDLNSQKKELTDRIKELKVKKDSAAPNSTEHKEASYEIFSLERHVQNIDEKLAKIPDSKKAGVVPETIKGFQAEKKGENLYQKVLSTKIYENGKTSTMLNSDDLGILPKFKPAIKAAGDWGNVKETYIGKKDGNISMRDLTLYRKAYVDQLTKEVEEAHGVKLDLASFGSTNLTSDYDATISLKGGIKDKNGKPVSEKVEAEVLKDFNAKFRAEWGAESGTTFDTNLYVKDFDLSTLKNAPLSPENQKADDDNQDALGLVKQRIHMTQDEWDGYVKKVVDGVPEQKKAAVQAKYDKANDYGVKREIELNKEIISINKPDIKVEDLTPKAAAALAKEIKDGAGDKSADIEAEASNRLYEKKLVGVKAKIESGKDLTGDAKEANDVEVKKLKGEALFFANEPYFSEGGVRHIVGNLQKLSKKPLEEQYEITKNQGMQSVSENIGDTMKEFEHHEHEGHGVAAYKSSKYVNRLCDAISATVGEKKTIDGKLAYAIPDDMNITLGGKEYALKDVVGQLKKANEPLLLIRGEKLGSEADLAAAGVANKGELASKKYAENVTLEPLKNAKTAEQYKSLLLEITSQVNIKARG